MSTKDYKISENILKAIINKETLYFRYSLNNDIYERVLTPIGFSNNDQSIILYTHYKKRYINVIPHGIQSWTEIEVKEMPNTSTINNTIYKLIETLEKSGYILYKPVE